MAHPEPTLAHFDASGFNARVNLGYNSKERLDLSQHEKKG